MDRMLAVVASLSLFIVACAGDDDVLNSAGRAPASGSGTVTLEWALDNGAGSFVSCAEAGASEVAVVAVGEDLELIESMSCYSGFGSTGLMAAGTHSFEVRLLAADGSLIDSVDLGDLSIVDTEITPLGEIRFSVAP